MVELFQQIVVVEGTEGGNVQKSTRFVPREQVEACRCRAIKKGLPIQFLWTWIMRCAKKNIRSSARNYERNIVDARQFSSMKSEAKLLP